MGLDSVELILKMEGYFRVRYSDLEIERVATVQEFSALTCRMMNVHASASPLRDRLTAKVNAVLMKLDLIHAPLAGTASIFSFSLLSSRKSGMPSLRRWNFVYLCPIWHWRSRRKASSVFE
jgi:hypothetical protein